MVRIFTILRNNWKKSTFITIVGNYGAYRLYNYIGDRQMMRENCRKASKLGDQSLPMRSKPRHVTVILNPVSGKRKAKKYYTKFVEPLLHLAGIRVSLIETESPGQAKEVMKIMSDCDCVAVVGGDGTVNEVLNGLLSRPDAATASKLYPIAIIPVGKKNSIAEHIHQKLPQRNLKEFLISSTMSLVHGDISKFDILAIKPIEGVHQMQYCFKGLKYGIYQDILNRNSSVILTQIRQYWRIFKRLIGSSKTTLPDLEHIEFSKPCIGCSQCYKGHQISDKVIVKNKENSPRRWWTSLVPISNGAKYTEEEKTAAFLSKRENSDCNTWSDLEATNISHFEANSVGHNIIELSLYKHNDLSPTETIQAQNVRLFVRSDGYNDEPASVTPADENERDTKDGDTRISDIDDKRPKFIVDGEKTACESVEISTLRDVIIFTGPLNI